MHNQSNFILSPICNILSDVVSGNYGLGNGIETYPLNEHILQSTFLKMTGFQEQKMKIICWELASVDFEYRYKRFTQTLLGACSTYKEKNLVYNDLLDQIKLMEPNFDVTTSINRKEIRRKTIWELQKAFQETNLGSWNQVIASDFFLNHTNLIKNHFFATSDNLLENVLQDKYELLYKHRNRCAHNTLSYQSNLPTLKELSEENYNLNNYPIRFGILILIDKVFIRLYEKYLCLKDN
ncbi:hypothetical protein SF1_18500 [Sphingobacterium faecium NBRC 15299]|uniref:hypothetical protein n=1 Tax=Sphingobacterium faecium TaxID=34087 RepID=UPI000D3B9D47|nr:hypothetical protein [Sphingobacterium faecium]PTX09511.1 hypothetical protein C8N37_106139 [Sphingobacterium faecium]GEM63868.1 hypothetical protein SF1_18500 [Sphingobacterium faecium NBRC 15299]